MEPSPPKGRKPQNQRPFYDAGRRTSAEIVAEARSNVKKLETNRPCTPLEANRRLFGSATSRSNVGRPPSSLSIGRSFSDSLSQPSSRPPSGRLTPIDGVSSTSLENLISSKAAEAVKGNQLPNENHEPSPTLESRLASLSQPSPPMSKEPEISRTRRCRSGRVGSPSLLQKSAERRAHSGPKERTNKEDANSIEKVIKKHSSVGDVSHETKDPQSTYIGTDSISNDVSNDAAEKSIVFIRDIITPLLKQMELNHLHGDLTSLAVNFDVLWEMLKRGDLFQKPTSSGLARGRAQVLRTIFKFADVQDPKILMKLSKLSILQREIYLSDSTDQFNIQGYKELNVTGKQQNNICKVLFVVSKDQSQDYLFKEEDLIGDIADIVGRAEISSELDWLIYAVGTLKFLAGSPLLQEDLVEKNCLGSLGKLLCTINVFLHGQHPGHVQIPHLLVQITAAVRNLIDISNARKQVSPSGISEILIHLLGKFSRDSDYVLNVSRIFSKLTLYSDCCHAISNIDSGYKNLFELLKMHKQSQGIVVRLLFTFGNIAAKVDESGLTYFRENDCFDILVSVCMEYMKKLRKVSVEKDGNQDKMPQNGEDTVEKVEDVLIKATRFIANLSVHPSIGPDISDNRDIIDVLLDIARNTLCRKNDELIVNTAATLNNISFYTGNGGYFDSRQRTLCEVLSECILTSSLECTIEITRVFGNLTRSKDVRRILVAKKFVEILVTLLDSNDREVLFSACGALINMMLEKDARQSVVDQKGVTKLVDALKDFGQTDWQLAGMICQCLWNFSDSLTSSCSCFGETEVEELLDVLQLFLESEFALDYTECSNMDSRTKEAMSETWKEQFVPVAQRLLERIRSCHTDLEPL